MSMKYYYNIFELFKNVKKKPSWLEDCIERGTRSDLAHRL